MISCHKNRIHRKGFLMKNFLKILWIIALVLVIGFSIAGCSNADEEEEEEEKTKAGGGGGNTLDWPADIKALGDVRYQGSGWGTLYIKFKPTYKNYENVSKPGYLNISNERAFYNGEKAFYETVADCSLSSVAGKTIKIDTGKTAGGVKTLCTDYTIVGNKITFTGGDELFSKINDVELSVF